MPRSPIEKALFVTILLGYLLAGGLYALYTPAWQAPDEPAHFNYLRQVAEAGCCPRIEEGDWDSEQLSLLTSSKFASDYLDGLDRIQYEDHHPPLYYLLGSLVYKLGAGQLITLRLFSVALGAGVVWLAYFIGKRIKPGQPQIALGAMALVGFTPQHLSMMSAVNNDALAELIVAVALLWSLRFLKGDSVPVWQLGLILGIALLTKLTIYFLALLLPLVIWLRWRREKQRRSALYRSLFILALVAVVIAGGWWLRNISVYGFPDFLALAAHDTVVADQPRSADYIAERGVGMYLAQFASVSFKSFWGQFGWMALPLDSVLDGWLYRGFAIFALAGMAGALLAARSRDIVTEIWLVLLGLTLLVGLQYLYYNLEFLQWQGRYLFPALIPIAWMLVYGIDYWRGRLFGRWGWARWLPVIVLLCLMALDLYLLFWVIVPGLSPG